MRSNTGQLYSRPIAAMRPSVYASPTVAPHRGHAQVRTVFSPPPPLLMRRAGVGFSDVPATQRTQTAQRVPKVIPISTPSMAGLRWRA